MLKQTQSGPTKSAIATAIDIANDPAAPHTAAEVTQQPAQCTPEPEHIAQPILSHSEPSLFCEQAQLKLLIDKFAHYADFGCAAPQPDRHGNQFEDLAYAYRGYYEETALSAEQDHRLRQGFDLQQWLGRDAMDNFPCLTDIPGMPEVLNTPWLLELPAPSSEDLAHYKASNKRKCNALRKLQKTHFLRLRQHVSVTEVLFKWLVQVTPTDMSITPLPLECMELLNLAQVDLPLEHNPFEAYKALSRRLLVQEKEFIETSMAQLRAELQGVRLGFYLEAGQFLKMQAQTIMKEYEDSVSGSSRYGDDAVYQKLEEVLEEPVFRMWPAPVQPEELAEFKHLEQPNQLAACDNASKGQGAHRE